MEGIEVVCEIGRGNYGSVWLVRRPGSPRNLVLKYVDLTHCSVAEVEAARQEVRILAGLRHPNIVSYKGSFEVGRRLHLLMGHCAGGDMASLIKRQRGQLFPEVKVVRWLIQITMALQYLHNHNILHRDLKTQNIFLTHSGLVKLGDFGIARILGSSYDMATTLVGTPYYMSPELFAGLPYNHKSDVWALGCCLYELATLRHAFPARDIPGLISKISKGKISGLHEKYSDDLRQLVLCLMTRSPEHRPSASQVLRFPYIRHHMSLFLKDTSDVENTVKHAMGIEEQHKRPQEREEREPGNLQCSGSCCTERQGDQSSGSTGEQVKQHKHPSARRSCETVVKEFDVLQIAGDRIKVEEEDRGETEPSSAKECHSPGHEPESQSAGHLHSQSRARWRGSREVEGGDDQGQSRTPVAPSFTSPKDLVAPRSSLSARERWRQQRRADVKECNSAKSAVSHVQEEKSSSEDSHLLPPSEDTDDQGNSNSSSFHSNTTSPTIEEEDDDFLNTLSSTLTASSSPSEEDWGREKQDDTGRGLEAKLAQLEENLVTMMGKVQARLVIEVLKEEADDDDDEVNGNWEARLNEVEQVLGKKLEPEAVTTAWHLHLYYVLQHACGEEEPLCGE